MFLDHYGRTIEVGHVLANGQRQSTHGGITVGVVTGFTNATILVKTLHVHAVYKAPPGQEELPYHQRTYSREHEEPQGYYWRKGSYREPKNCFITGQTEEQLVANFASTLGVAEIEDPRIAQNREWKEKWAARQAELAKEEAEKAEQQTQQESAMAKIAAIVQEYGDYD